MIEILQQYLYTALLSVGLDDNECLLKVIQGQVKNQE